MERIKECTKCGVKKELDEFYKNKGTKDGRSCWCKECIQVKESGKKEEYTKVKELVAGVVREVIYHEEFGRLVNCANEPKLRKEGYEEDFFENYWVNLEEGVVYRWTGRKLKRCLMGKDRGNRQKVKTSKIINGKGVAHQQFVHRIVAIIGIPNPENKPNVCHKKPVTKEHCDNGINNLSWGTQKENMNDEHAQTKRMETRRANNERLKLEAKYIKGEIWAEIDGEIFPKLKGEFISNMGRRKNKKGEFLAFYPNEENNTCRIKGYLIYVVVASHFNSDGTPREEAIKIHTDKGSNTQVDHINRDHTDNRATNLRIVTHSENMRNTKSNALVIMLDFETKKPLGEWKLAVEYAKETGIKNVDSISNPNHSDKSSWIKNKDHTLYGRRVTFYRKEEFEKLMNNN